MKLQKILAGCSLLLSLIQISLAQTPISSQVFGMDGWLPSNFKDFNAPGGIPVDHNYETNPNDYFGRMDLHWNDIVASGCRLIRFGEGTDENYNQQPKEKYVYYVQQIKSRGMIPLMGVAVGEKARPANGNISTEATYQDGTRATEIVNILNSGGPASPSYTKYFMIGNEYDIIGYTPSECYTKISTLADAMRTEYNLHRTDPKDNIVIIGPELAYYNAPYIDQLISLGILNKIDMFSFHTYPFNDESKYDANIPAPTRSNVIASLNSLRTSLGELQQKLSNAGHPGMPVAITEANICHIVDLTGNSYNTSAGNTSGTGGTDNTAQGDGANGFVAGQFWAEMLGVCMEKGVQWINFHSIIEGGGGSTDVGYLQDDAPGTPKSTYYHYQLMGKYFKGDFYPSSGAPSGVKVFACKTTGYIAVMILNENDGSTNASGHNDFSFQLGGTGSNTLLSIPGVSAAPRPVSISNNSTRLLFYSCDGSVPAGQIDYSLGNTAPTGSAPFLYAGPDLGPDQVTGINCYHTFSVGSSYPSDATFQWYSRIPALNVDRTVGSSVGLGSGTIGSVPAPFIPIQGATGSYYSTNVPMEYQVVVSWSSGCTASDQVILGLDPSQRCIRIGPGLSVQAKNRNARETGAIEEDEQQTSLEDGIPNPASSKTTIGYVLSSQVKQAELVITDISGRMLQKIVLKRGADHADIDCSQLPGGIYFYTLLTEGLPAGTKKMVVAK